MSVFSFSRQNSRPAATRSGCLNAPQPSWRTWLAALRLPTLPLGVSGALVGCAWAWHEGAGNALVSVLCIALAAALQILSNLANDYGDACHAVDTPLRRGPVRMVGSGQISADAMRCAVFVAAGISAFLGLGLLAAAYAGGVRIAPAYLLGGGLGVGAAALAAAVAYSMGRRPYGSRGLGDVAVLVFFGWINVLGSAKLNGAALSLPLLAVACAIGLWCTAVLNINNMRDIRSDSAAGKRSVAVRLGLQGALYYHAVLVGTGAAAWLLALGSPIQTPIWGVGLVSMVLLLRHSMVMRGIAALAQEEADAPVLNRELKIWSLSVLIMSVSAAAAWLCF